MITVHIFHKNDISQWDDFVINSNNGTIFHQQKFLGYHHDKFLLNENSLIFRKNGNIIAVIPIAIFNSNGRKIAKSPFGASWGGIVYNTNLGINYINEIVKVLIDHLKNQSINELKITLQPDCYCYQSNYFLDFSLYSNGFSMTGYELFHTINLKVNYNDSILNIFDSKCRNQVRNGLKKFKIKRNCTIDEFYPILLEDKIRHHSLPTHTYEELKLLNTLYPNEVLFSIAETENGKKAGICYFVCNKNCILTFYMCQENDALGLNGLNALVYDGVVFAAENNFQFFDFGGSSVNGIIQNIGVSQFKESFGANGYIRRTYTLLL